MTTLKDSGTFIDRVLAAEARQRAGLVVRRLADPDVVAEAVTRAEAAAEFPFSWGGAAFYSGHAGSALAFQYASRAMPADAGFWLGQVRAQLAEAVASTHEVPLMTAGLAAGTAGLASALSDCAADEPRYAGALGELNAKLASQVVEAPTWLSEDGVADGDYDVIAGASGILAHLASAERGNPAVQRATNRLVDDLCHLCEPPSAGPRPWRIPPARYPMAEYRESYPHGYVNLGLAHGVAGPLAALSVAYEAGHGDERVRATIRATADYLRGASIEDDHGWNWPAGIPLTGDGDEDRAELVPTRSAWCYGAPGIACALLRASAALADGELKAAAVEVFDGALRRFRHHGRFGSATLCHGAAGLLAMCVMFARETGSELARGSVAPLTEHLLSHCDEALPLGVQDLEQPQGALLDSPGLLSGAAGVALALWSAAGAIGHRWERAFLIS
ncbi:lanthionine synthetase C family protein [Amycolatopsis sp. NPDC059021]|uniref:lanthionine synthetase C family protein n=1 Tax=Amycolatopsis sp. NPDC059021 TaxID=3346704 RepID=UPI00366F990E